MPIKLLNAIVVSLSLGENDALEVKQAYCFTLNFIWAVICKLSLESNEAFYSSGKIVNHNMLQYLT